MFQNTFKFFSKWTLSLVYDFGCNLHNYLLNREPREIEFKRVFVDSFHYKNHTACASSYDAANYKKYLPKGFYTTGREQINSKLSKIEESFRQMNYKEQFICFLLPHAFYHAILINLKGRFYELKRKQINCTSRIGSSCTKCSFA